MKNFNFKNELNFYTLKVRTGFKIFLDRFKDMLPLKKRDKPLLPWVANEIRSISLSLEKFNIPFCTDLSLYTFIE